MTALWDSTGAAVIFGNTGGVTEAALRTVYEILTGKELNQIEFSQVRGLEGIREANIDINGMDVKVAIVNGTTNAANILKDIRAGKKNYHFIEIMACPGGCINGGGQPILMDKEMTEEVKKKRIEGIYSIDRGAKRRKSHENLEVKALYEEYLGSPGSHKSHHLLHTTYLPRTASERIDENDEI